MRRASTRRGLLAAGAALLGTIAGCQWLGDGDGGGSTPGDGDDADGTPTAASDDGEPTASDETVSVGTGSFLDSVPDGKPTPPDDVDVAEGVEGPYPSNDWWTTLLWGEYGARLWSHPLVTDAGSDGLAVGAPREWAFTNGGPAGPNFAQLPWRRDLVVGPADGTGVDRTLVTGWGDWSVDYRLDGAGIEVTRPAGRRICSVPPRTGSRSSPARAVATSRSSPRMGRRWV